MDAGRGCGLDVDRHGVPYVRSVRDRAGGARSESEGRVDPCVRSCGERALVAGRPHPAGVLGQGKSTGCNGQHEQERRPALAKRLPAHLPAGERSSQPPSSPREPVARSRGERQQAQRDNGPAGQRERWGEDEYRVD